jgi:hypothetical protein
MKWIRYGLFVFILLNQQVQAQSSFSGVYAGIETMLGGTIGSMSRIDHVILFRPDGTFNSDIHKADWKTTTTGHYTVTGKKVVLNFTKGGKDVYDLDGETLSGGTYFLVKLQENNSIPAGRYHFISAVSSGVASPGTAYAGATSSADLWFDGKGNFSRNASSSSQFGGSAVAGGSTHSSSGDGNYAIKDGLLTLTYTDGRIETHSFFSSGPSEKTTMAAVDGKIFFTDDPAEKKSVSDDRSILYKANEIQGGARLDHLSSVKATATVNGLRLVSTVDLTGGKFRLEVWKGDVLAVAEVFDGSSGWQEQNGNKTPLSGERIKEIRTAFNSGVLGLRRQVIDRMQAVKVQSTANNTMTVTCTIDGVIRVFVLDAKNQLIGDGSKTAASTNISEYSDLRPVNGVLLPFAEISQNGATRLNIRYTQYELN